MISDVIFNNPNIDKTSVAIKTSSEEITYVQLQETIKEFANLLVEKGCSVGKRVLIWMNNSPELIISYFAINLIGGIAILADTKFKHEIYDIIAENSVGMIIINCAQKEELSTKGEIITIVMEEENLNIKSMDNMEEYVKALELKEELISTVIYTSGSTGRPKGVLNSHKNLKEALRNYTETMGFTREDIFLGIVPFFHSYAFGSCMMSAFHSGAKLILMNSFIPAKALRLIQDAKITIFHGVPFMYKLINRQMEITPYNCSSLRLCISAGSRLEEKYLRQFYDATRMVVHQEYGSTETGTIAINLSNDVDKAIKYVGQPLKNVELRLISVDETDNTILCVKSNGMAIGYIGEEPFNRNGYMTKDLCDIEDGNLIIKGRTDRLINITGLKVNPIEVENCLKQHSEIIDAFVKGTVSNDFGDAVEASIVRKNDSLTKKEVVTYCKNNLASYKVPSIIKWVNAIEKTGMGKTRYS